MGQYTTKYSHSHMVLLNVAVLAKLCDCENIVVGYSGIDPINTLGLSPLMCLNRFG